MALTLQPVTLAGRHVSLVPLSVEHAPALADAARDGELWRLWYTTVPSPDNMAREIARRLSTIFTLNEKGHRPCFGDNCRYADDPFWRDHVLFHEYFHGDTGRGVGASHQTGWTGLVAKLLQPRHTSHHPQPPSSHASPAQPAKP